MTAHHHTDRAVLEMRSLLQTRGLLEARRHKVCFQHEDRPITVVKDLVYGQTDGLTEL